MATSGRELVAGPVHDGSSPSGEDRLLRTVAAHAADAVYCVGVDRRATWVSPSMRDCLGWEPDQLLGQELIDLVHPDDRAVLSPVREEVYAGRVDEHLARHLLYRWRRSDGTYRWMSVRVTLLTPEHPGEHFAVVALRDVDEIVRLGGSAGLVSEAPRPPRATASRSDRRRTPRRRRDRDVSVLLPAVTHTLRTEPSPDQLTDFLLTLLRAPLGVEQVALVAEGTHEGNARSIWGCRPALAEAPLDGIPLPGSRDILAATDRPLVPQDGAAGTLIATALIDDADLRVWLVVATPSGEDIEHVRETLQELHGVLALYVTQIRHAREARTAVVVPHGITALTPRQHRILRLMAEGLTNQQIALRIGYSTSTVRMENLHIFRALDVHDRAAAVRVARAESAT